jgi:hypothetical protein
MGVSLSPFASIPVYSFVAPLRFYEAQEQTDPFTGELPNAKNLLERVEPPVVEEDLWADYKKKPPRPIYFG